MFGYQHILNALNINPDLAGVFHKQFLYNSLRYLDISEQILFTKWTDFDSLVKVSKTS